MRNREYFCSKVTILEGKKILSIDTDNRKHITFNTDDGSYIMMHEQDCCENVEIEDIDGDLVDLILETVVSAEESSSNTRNEEGEESMTWTFYTIRTVKSSVTIRWYGTSNGYYSESVELYKLLIDELYRKWFQRKSSS